MQRKTRQREIIKQALAAAARPLAPQQVLEQAQLRLPSLGLATVYRALKALVDEGWLIAVELPGAVQHYELAGQAHHHHFHCRACDGVFEVEGCPPKIDSLAPSGFKLETHELVLYGLCADCAEAA
jgi:Fur family ferric uptake transcriptional regulator